jgi:myo-inositol catabolism protein IolC
VRCVVLGSGADQHRVEHWLRKGAGAEGFAGFAIGRTIWFDTLKSWLSGDVDRAEAARRIAAPYLHAIVVYENAAAACLSLKPS